jgi:hypothetical protein
MGFAYRTCRNEPAILKPRLPLRIPRERIPIACDGAESQEHGVGSADCPWRKTVNQAVTMWSRAITLFGHGGRR